jgi:hypothetical protein
MLLGASVQARARSLVHDFVSCAEHSHRDVGVLGEGVGAHAARRIERLPPERACCARDGRDAPQQVHQPAIEVEAADVLQVLPPSEQPPPVAHLGVATDGAHQRVTQRLDEVPDRVGLEDGVTIEHHQDVV